MELKLIELLSQYGLPGLAMAVVGLMTYHLWRDLKASWENRITESRQLVQCIESTNHAYTTLASSNEARAKTIEALAHTQLAMSQSLDHHMESLKRIEERQVTQLRLLEAADHQLAEVKQATDRLDRSRP